MYSLRIGWLCSTLRIRDIVSIADTLLSFEGSCDVRRYRRQRFKPFGLISTRLVGYTIPQVAEVQTLWLVGQCFLGMRYYRRQRFQTLWLISARLRVLISASSRGSNPLACRTGFIWLLFLWIGHRFQTLWVYDRFGSLSAWVQILWLEWTCFEGFCLERKLWVVFRVCLSCLWSPGCVAWGLSRVCWCVATSCVL